MDLFRPKWTKTDHFGPFWSRECENPVRNKVHSDHNGRFDHFEPVHFLTVPRPLPIVPLQGHLADDMKDDFSNFGFSGLLPENPARALGLLLRRISTEVFSGSGKSRPSRPSGVHTKGVMQQHADS